MAPPESPPGASSRPHLVASSLAATVLASALVHASVSPDTELASEAVCWVLLALSRCFVASRPGTVADSAAKGQRHHRQRLATARRTMVGAVVVGALSRAVTDTRWIAPILVPIVVAMRPPDRNTPQRGSPASQKLYRHYKRDIYRHIAIGALSLLLLLSTRRLGILDVPSAAVQGTTVVLALTSLDAASRPLLAGDKDDEKPGTGFEDGNPGRKGGGSLDLVMSVSGVLAFCMSTAAVLTTYVSWTALDGMPPSILWGGFWKAAWWAAMMRLARDAPWETSLGIDALALSWRYGLDSAPYIDGMVLTAAAGFLSLFQLQNLLPKTTEGTSRTRWIFWLSALICVSAPLSGLSRTRDFGNLPAQQHPAEQLHAAAARNFDGLIKRQSSTLGEAVAEYRRRYAHDPPLGFDKWFEYALSKKSPIVDDFDTIHEGLRPLWRYSAEHMNQTTSEAAKWNLNVVRCGIVAGNFTTGNCGMFGERIGELLAEVQHQLPDVIFAVNLLDEPAVLPLTQPEVLGMNGFWKLISGGPAIDAVAAACDKRDPPAPRFPSVSVETHGLPFVTDIMDTKDVCRHPEYGASHGFLVAPSTLAYSRHLFPLLSRASPHPFSDILFPSPHYVREGEKYNPADDVAWEDKINGLYWAGKATGLRAFGDRWRQGHRQRLVLLPDNPPYTYLTGLESESSANPGTWKPFESADFDSWLFDAHISELVQCSSMACLAEARALRPSQYMLPSDGPTAPYRHRLALDIDGNSYSGRFYRLLASGSLTLKATLFREWHDDRLVPWFHYVPVSVGLGELPELVRFLTRTERGRALARAIAGNGREWHDRALRGADMSVYMYRLVLELARLFDLTRMPGETDGAAGGYGGHSS